MRGVGVGRNNNYSQSCRNPCITMHQPWASLLVSGIKRIEGRSWPTPLRGQLWIHAASKVPDPATIKVMENFYREIYAVNGITNLEFPEHYPVSRLLGCVKVVGCVTREELVCWEEVPEGVRLEGLTDFCWLCETPQKILVPCEMRGYQGVYDLEMEIYETVVQGLCTVEGPQPIQFPFPDPRNPFSLKPGSLVPYLTESKTVKLEKSASLTAAIAGARAAATQFSKKEPKHRTNAVKVRHTFDPSSRQHSENKFTEADRKSMENLRRRPQERDSRHSYKEQNTHANCEGNLISYNQAPRRETKHPHNIIQERHTLESSSRRLLENKFTEVDRKSIANLRQRPQERDSRHSYKDQNTQAKCEGNITSYNRSPRKETKHQPNIIHERLTLKSSSRRLPESKFTENDGKSIANIWQRPQERDSRHSYMDQNTHAECEGNIINYNRAPRKEMKHQPNTMQERHTFESSSRQLSENKFTEDDRKSTATLQWRPRERDPVHSDMEQNVHVTCEENNNQTPRRDLNQGLRVPSKIFVAALKGLRPAETCPHGIERAETS